MENLEHTESIEQEDKIYISNSIFKNLPLMVQKELSKMTLEKQEEFVEEFKRKSKSVGMAYLFLFIIFSAHYAYLKKWGIQILYWVTVGGAGIWFIICIFIIPNLVRNYNKEIAIDILKDLKIISN
ncbi:MAG TPA: TM2 domain-containing protein [Paludibacteraceae bacterium]|nr:TM2 domain-containing protein [Paludibacteraceae bacterium]